MGWDIRKYGSIFYVEMGPDQNGCLYLRKYHSSKNFAIKMISPHSRSENNLTICQSLFLVGHLLHQKLIKAID